MTNRFRLLTATMLVAATVAGAFTVSTIQPAEAAVAGAAGGSRTGGGTPGGGNPGGNGKGGDDSGALAFILSESRSCDLYEQRIILPNGDIIIDTTVADVRFCEELMIRE